jgi:hypothetical protein
MTAAKQLRAISGDRRWLRYGPRLPNGWRDAILQLALWGLADLLYEGVRGIVTGQTSIAFANGRAVIALEQSTGLFFEPQLQEFASRYHGLMVSANWVYLNAQFTVNLLFMAIIYCYRNDIFYFVRNMFFIAMGIALIVHLAVPVAPPRMFPEYGFVDTVHSFAHINQDSGAVSMFVNPYAAVPSMHMCFALLVGVTGFRLARNRLLQILAMLYPIVILLAIVVTANHFVFDAAAGAATAVVAAIASQRVMARFRPDWWSWGQGRLSPQPLET